MTLRLSATCQKDPLVRAIYRASRIISRYFDVHIHGLDHVPNEGGLMLVGNHAIMGIDAWALVPEFIYRTGRVPRPMALRSLFKVPLVSHSLRWVGMVQGTRASAIELLNHGEVVLTYPGGVHDSLRSQQRRYQLEWAGRTGFAHAAAAAGAPVVPVVGVGPDECFRILVDKPLLPTKALGRRGPRAPLFVPLAKRVPFDFYLGEPIEPPASTSEASAKKFAKHVQAQTQLLLDRGVEARTR